MEGSRSRLALQCLCSSLRRVPSEPSLVSICLGRHPSSEARISPHLRRHVMWAAGRRASEPAILAIIRKAAALRVDVRALALSCAARPLRTAARGERQQEPLSGIALRNPRGTALLRPCDDTRDVYRQSRAYATLAPAKAQDPALYATLRPISFSIIAHIDHGKSTLADRLLERTGTIPIGPDGQTINRQVLDSLKVERERGITVKSQAVSMVYEDHTGSKWLLNLIDTPGHVDFAYEVSRSLSACQIALLVVDATQGIQSQTLSVFRVAKQRGLHIIPVINKVDLPGASPEGVIEQLTARLGLDVSAGSMEEAVHVSAKTGLNVEQVLAQVVKIGQRIEAGLARGEDEKLRALVFDSWYDPYRGVVALVAVKDGLLRKGDKISSAHSRKRYEVLDVGVNSPTAVSTGLLRKGQVGWVISNMKQVLEASIGDTLHHASTTVEPLPGFKPSQPMIYCSAFALSSSDFPKLEAAVQKLALNDRSVSFSRESSNALGQGVKLGLLGALHLEIFRARLADEYGMEILVTNPTVAYRVVRHGEKAEEGQMISNPLDFPEEALRNRRSTKGVSHIEEPMVIGTLTCPEEYIGSMMQLCAERRGEEVDIEFQEGFDATSADDVGRGSERMVIMKYRMPLSEIVTDFFGVVKSKTAGFASFDYEDDGWQESDLVKVRKRVGALH